MSKKKTTTETATAAAAHAPDGAPVAPELLATFAIDARDAAHDKLAELQQRHPKAECRENWGGNGLVEIWSGPAA